MSDKTIEEEIAEVRTQLDTEKKEQVTTESTVAALSAKLAKLEALRDEITRAEEAYEKAYAALDAERQELEDYVESEEQYLLTLITSAELDSLAKLVTAKYEELEGKDGQVKTATAKHEGSCTHWVEGAIGTKAAAQKALDEAKAEADRWKTPVSSIQARFAKLNTRRADVNKAQADDKPVLAYWLLIHAGIPSKAGTDTRDKTFKQLVAESPAVVKPKDLGQEIRDAVDALNTAETAYLEAAAQEKRTKELLGEAKADLTSFKQQFEADTLAKIDDIRSASDDQVPANSGSPGAAPPGPPPTPAH